MWNRILYAISIIAVIWLFAMVFAVANGDDLTFIINSDTIYQPSLYWDLIENQNSISDWSLNPSPNFFPDMLIYFLIMKITGKIMVSSFIFALVQVLAINLLFARILKHLTLEYLKIMLIVNAVFVLFACTRLITNNFGFLFNFISNSYHLGSFVMMLIGFNFMLSYINENKLSTIFFLFITIVFGFMSDRLFLVNFCVPAVVSCLFFIKSPALKKLFPVLVVSILGPLFGQFIIHQLVATLHYISIEEPNSFLNWNNIYHSLTLFLSQLLVYMKEMSAVTIIVVISFVSLVLLSIRSFTIVIRRKYLTTMLDFAIVFICISSYTILLSPILAGNYTGFDTIRYNYHAYILLTVSFPLILLEFLPYLKLKLEPIGVGFATMVIGLTIFLTFTHHLNFEKYFNFYPKEAQNADLFYEKTGLKVGSSDYWDAKLITLFSKHNLLVFATFENLMPYHHVTNRNWFHVHSKKDGGSPIEFQFTILDNDLRKEIARTKFSNYKDSIVKINDQYFMILPEYTYSEDLEVIQKKEQP